MPRIQVLVGPIASGKSTYTRNAAKNGQIIINDDSIVNMVHADIYTLYDKNLKILYKSIENQILALGVAMKKNVCVDRGLNVSVQGRRRWLALADSFDVPCEAIVFDNEGPEVHARRRADSDARGVSYESWLKVAERHNSDYKEPTKSEGFDKIHYITWADIQNGVVF